MRSSRIRLLGSVIAFGLPLLIYILTLAREITWVDSGELAAVAAKLGIAHPPGYPLFTLLGHLFSWIPVGSVAFRVGLLSAVTTAVAALLVYRTGVILLDALAQHGREPSSTGAASSGNGSPAGGGTRDLAALAGTRDLAALAGALLFAFARTPWSQAVEVEVYGLQVMMAAALLAVIARALLQVDRATLAWPAVALLSGFLLTNHLTGALLLTGALAFVVISLIAWWRRSDRPPLPIGRSIVAAVAPLLLYLYLPVRGAGPPGLSWDFPTTLTRLYIHVSARQYQGLLGHEGMKLGELQRFFGEQLPQEAGWSFVVLAVLGFLALLVRGRRFLLVTALPLLGYLLYNMAYPIHDIHLYYIPPLAILGMWAAVGAGILASGVVRLAGLLTRSGRQSSAQSVASVPGPAARLVGVFVAVVLCLTCLVPLTTHWENNDQSDFNLVAYYTRDTLRYLDENAFLFSGRWDEVSSPALYYQYVEGFRPDVLVINVPSLTSTVLLRKLERQAPDLAEACREEMESLVEITHLAELGRPYDVEEARYRFAVLKRALIEAAVELRPTYATSNLFRAAFLQGFELHTEGLVTRVCTDDAYRPFPIPEFEGPGITMSQVRNEREHEIWFEYGRMLRNRARYLNRHGRAMEAKAVGQKAEVLSR